MNMAGKTMAAVVCTLMLVSIISPVIGSAVQIDERTPRRQSVSGDTPQWNVGDSWTFDGEGAFEMEESPLFLNLTGGFSGVQFIVTDEDADTYYVDFEGDLEAALVVTVDNPPMDISATLRKTTLSGYVYFNKSDMGIREFYLNITGSITASIEPIPLPFSMSIRMTFTPPYAVLVFPLTVGSEWRTSSSEMVVELGEDLISLIEQIVEMVKKLVPSDVAEILDTLLETLKDMFPLEISVGSELAECVERENLTVKAGTYESYHISIYMVELDFSPAAENIIRLFLTDEYYGHFGMELTSSTYRQPGVPEKPETPSGKMRGRLRKNYEYETSATDPDGDRIQYGWDWDGDGTVDEWTDFYNSGETVLTPHSWTERGSYEIRVRARDEHGLAGEWSDPLAVTMPSQIWHSWLIWLITQFFQTIRSG